MFAESKIRSFYIVDTEAFHTNRSIPHMHIRCDRVRKQHNLIIIFPVLIDNTSLTPKYDAEEGLVSKLSFPEIFKSDSHVTDIPFHPAAKNKFSLKGHTVAKPLLLLLIPVLKHICSIKA